MSHVFSPQVSLSELSRCHVILVVHMRATCSTKLILLDLMMLIKFEVTCKLCFSSYSNNFPVVLFRPLSLIQMSPSAPCSRTPSVLLQLNPLNPELNPICYLLALLGAHHFLHVSRIRVRLLTFRLLMLYIYIYGAPILDVSRSHTTTQHSR